MTTKLVLVALFLFFAVNFVIDVFGDDDNENEGSAASVEDSKCKVPCPANEAHGQKRCNGCEPTCDNRNPEVCTKMYCSCSCDCKKGWYRNMKTAQCVPVEQCP